VEGGIVDPPALTFSDPARRRMRRRGIDEETVRVLADPDSVLERDDECAEYVAVVQEAQRDRRLEVVLDEARRPPHVVTVYELEDESR
jgi:Domain of unknown function (DUF4258)